MSDLPVSTEMIEFAANVARGTFANKLDWETTADEDVLLAPLGGPYTARFEQVLRMNEEGDEYQTFELGLLKGREELFRLDAGTLSSTSFARSSGITSNSWTALREMWTRALLKAKKVTDELNEVNRLLNARLGPSPAVAVDDDEDVPF